MEKQVSNKRIRENQEKQKKRDAGFTQRIVQLSKQTAEIMNRRNGQYRKSGDF
jgi:hypothetical protein